MTGSDLIVLAPWILFGAGLTVIFLRLLRSRPPSRCPPAPPGARQLPDADDPGGSPGAILRTGQADGPGQRGPRSL
jgi:hypothetical protein